MNNNDKRALAATLRLRSQLAWAVTNACQDLALPTNYVVAVDAYTKEKVEAPLYVAEIRILGAVARDMYDEHPGIAYFWQETYVIVEVPAYCRVSKAKEIALEAFEQCTAQNLETDETSDGDFSPRGIVLQDQFGGALLEYSNGQWQTELPVEADWDMQIRTATELEGEAHEEARWDNFETAKGLRARAERIRRSVQCAKSMSRCIH